MNWSFQISNVLFLWIIASEKKQKNSKEESFILARYIQDVNVVA